MAKKLFALLFLGIIGRSCSRQDIGQCGARREVGPSTVVLNYALTSYTTFINIAEYGIA